MKITIHNAEYVSGTSNDVKQRQIIRDNIALWRRERQKRERRQVEMDDAEQRERDRKYFHAHFNSVNDAFGSRKSRP